MVYCVQYSRCNPPYAINITNYTYVDFDGDSKNYSKMCAISCNGYGYIEDIDYAKNTEKLDLNGKDVDMVVRCMNETTKCTDNFVLKNYTYSDGQSFNIRTTTKIKQDDVEYGIGPGLCGLCSEQTEPGLMYVNRSNISVNTNSGLGYDNVCILIAECQFRYLDNKLSNTSEVSCRDICENITSTSTTSAYPSKIMYDFEDIEGGNTHQRTCIADCNTVGGVQYYNVSQLNLYRDNAIEYYCYKYC